METGLEEIDILLINKKDELFGDILNKLKNK
jgi:hypothetical protein